MKRNLTIHILCWSIVLFLPLLFFTAPTASWSLTLMRWLRSLGGPLCYMVIFYVNYLWLIPRFYFQGRKTAFFAINIGLIALMMGVMMGWWQMVNDWMPQEGQRPPRHGPRPPHMPMYFYNTISLVLVVGLSLAVRLTQHWQHAEQARKAAEQSRTEAELSNLRNQLNPHFLLNTLNNIYALIAFDTDKAQLAVDELSRLLRHVLYDNQQDFVPLYKEVAFMRNYIELMRIRVTDGVKIETDIQVAGDDSTPIAPLIFISLLENAFKHGISPQGKGHIHIAMSQQGGQVTCAITNSNYPKRANDKSGSGIGLEQVGKRLELIYPGQYQWQRGLDTSGNEYHSEIVINTICNNSSPSTTTNP